MSSNIKKANTGNLIGSQVKSHQKFKISNNQLEKQCTCKGLIRKGVKNYNHQLNSNATLRQALSNTAAKSRPPDMER